MQINQALHYHQICSVPRKCVVKSRDECDTSVNFCGWKFRSCYLPANMASVVHEENAKWLAFNHYFYIYHRFGDTRKFLQRARSESWPLISISIGVKAEDKQLIDDIAESKCRVDFVTIDIANGFSDFCVEMIQCVKQKLPKTKVIAGNVWGDKDSIEFLQDAGADAIKVGLSMGKACLSFPTTSFGSPMFSAALEAGQWAKVPVILDGGVREMGDIARAMIGFMDRQGEYTYGGRGGKVYPNGVNVPLVMIGSLFAACIDAPGEDVYANSKTYIGELGVHEHKGKVTHKRYYGSASAENKQKTGQEVKNIEGKSIDIPCNGKTYEEFCESLNQAIRSQISYGGGKDVTCFKDVEWRVIS